jgi:tRNA pseudouridine55 synthase
MNGVLPIAKPIGMTSKDVSRRLVKKFGKLKWGHVGTLDPDADGVLVLLCGNATKVQDYLLDMPKSYEFTMELGRATTTLDAAGDIVAEAPFDQITKDQVIERSRDFLGFIEQVPPLYSAVKYKGRELYKWSRQLAETSENVSHETTVPEENAIDWQSLKRHVRVTRFELVKFEAPFITFQVDCSKGTYVRTLASDLAQKLGTLGHVRTLQRTRASGFNLNDCCSLEQIEADGLERYLRPLESVSIGLPEWHCSDSILALRLAHGQRIQLDIESIPLLKKELAHELEKVAESFDFLAKDERGELIGVVTALKSRVVGGNQFLSGDQTSEINESKNFILHLKRGLKCHRA